MTRGGKVVGCGYALPLLSRALVGIHGLIENSPKKSIYGGVLRRGGGGGRGGRKWHRRVAGAP